MAALAAGIPNTAAVNTVNRQCSSGLTAVNQIANEIRTGQIEIGIGELASCFGLLFLLYLCFCYVGVSFYPMLPRHGLRPCFEVAPALLCERAVLIDFRPSSFTLPVFTPPYATPLALLVSTMADINSRCRR